MEKQSQNDKTDNGFAYGAQIPPLCCFRFISCRTGDIRCHFFFFFLFFFLLTGSIRSRFLHVSVRVCTCAKCLALPFLVCVSSLRPRPSSGERREEDPIFGLTHARTYTHIHIRLLVFCRLLVFSYSLFFTIPPYLSQVEQKSLAPFPPSFPPSLPSLSPSEGSLLILVLQ